MTKSQLKVLCESQANKYIEAHGPIGDKHSLYVKEGVVNMMQNAFIAGALYAFEIGAKQ